MLPYVASLMSGTVTGMMVGDSLGAIPTSANVPATSASANPQVTGDGMPVPNTTSPRTHLTVSALMVVAAIVVLFAGSRFLRDARI